VKQVVAWSRAKMEGVWQHARIRDAKQRVRRVRAN